MSALIRCVIITVLLLNIFSAGARSLYICQWSGTKTTFAVSEIKKITFAQGQMNIEKHGGSTINFAFEDIRLVTGSDFISSHATVKAPRQSVVAYPCPVAETLHVKLQEEAVGITVIMSTTGSIVSAPVNMIGPAEYHIDVRHLPKGLYYCSFGEGKMVQYVKFIKQ